MGTHFNKILFVLAFGTDLCTPGSDNTSISLFLMSFKSTHFKRVLASFIRNGRIIVCDRKECAVFQNKIFITV